MHQTNWRITGKSGICWKVYNISHYFNCVWISTHYEDTCVLHFKHVYGVICQRSGQGQNCAPVRVKAGRKEQRELQQRKKKEKKRIRPPLVFRQAAAAVA